MIGGIPDNGKGPAQVIPECFVEVVPWEGPLPEDGLIRLDVPISPNYKGRAVYVISTGSPGQE